MKFTASTLLLLSNFVVNARVDGPNAEIAQQVGGEIIDKILPKKPGTAIVNGLVTSLVGTLAGLADTVRPDSPPPPELAPSNSNEQNATLAGKYVATNFLGNVPVVPDAVAALSGAIGTLADIAGPAEGVV
ncbi:hypothetical protein C8F04DRAFT_1234460 [Mycena alexandri]|uniref:Uncharacterized protein n=1 Tax=Mycena alexandri TaxID=1745969 RepID=A0AAD6X471_9AGAR|nr:hypothetical protein C8F04DRAFT_1234460 [Mycena alexandri]